MALGKGKMNFAESAREDGRLSGGNMGEVRGQCRPC